MCKAVGIENQILRDDLAPIVNEWVESSKVFENKNVLITGATGLIGKALVRLFLMLSNARGNSVSVVAHGRSIDKLRQVFKEFKDNRNLVLCAGDLSQPTTSPQPIHFVIHAACPTASKEFVEKPVEVIDSIYQSTLNILRLAQSHKVESVVYLSSMEMYGQFLKEVLVSENDLGYIDTLSPRSSYPQAKRLAELLCASFYHEKGVPVKIARLSMIFGPGIDSSDRRVLNYFVQQIKSNNPIQLLTSGKSKASVLYLADAVAGILRLLVYGTNGEAYNLANPSNYYSIFEMAKIAASIKGVDVLISQGIQAGQNPYRNDNFLNLDVKKATALGWTPKVDLETIFKRVLISQDKSD